MHGFPLEVCTSPSCNDDEAAMGNGVGAASHHPDCPVHVDVGARDLVVVAFFWLFNNFFSFVGSGKDSRVPNSTSNSFQISNIGIQYNRKERERADSRAFPPQQGGAMLEHLIKDEPWRQRQHQQEAAEVEGSTKAKERLLSVRE